jgi:hypothetical protein
VARAGSELDGVTDSDDVQARPEDADAPAQEEPGARRRHLPYARRVRLGWRQDGEGAWTFDAEDRRLWEVCCFECGDTDGPPERQAPHVQALRGPYESKRLANRMVKRHFIRAR